MHAYAFTFNYDSSYKKNPKWPNKPKNPNQNKKWKKKRERLSINLLLILEKSKHIWSEKAALYALKTERDNWPTYLTFLL